MSSFTKKDVIKKSLNVVTRKDAGTTNTLKKGSIKRLWNNGISGA